LICAGQGDEIPIIRAALGDDVSCPGYLDPAALARLYASADVFAFPSKVEECANVVLEALASGLPVMVTQEAGMGRFVMEGRTGFVLPGDKAEAWTATLEMLAYDHERRIAMGCAARDYAERKIPSWKDILAGTLLPMWRRAASAAWPT
jgi:glycosyltransferase involved in cell wall biosynthesis